MANDDILETGSFPIGPRLKNLACNARDTSSVPGSRKSHRPERTQSLQHNSWEQDLEPTLCN